MRPASEQNGIGLLGQIVSTIILKMDVGKWNLLKSWQWADGRSIADASLVCFLEYPHFAMFHIKYAPWTLDSGNGPSYGNRLWWCRDTNQICFSLFSHTCILLVLVIFVKLVEGYGNLNSSNYREHFWSEEEGWRIKEKVKKRNFKKPQRRLGHHFLCWRKSWIGLVVERAPPLLNNCVGFRYL